MHILNLFSTMITNTAASVNYIRFDPLNGYLYSASDDCSLRVWDVQGVSGVVDALSGFREDVKHVAIQVENEQMGKLVELKCVSIHPFSGLVAVGCSDNIARIYTTVTNMDNPILKRATLSGHAMPVTDVCWSNKGDRLATASTNDGTVRCWSWSENFKRIDHTVLRINRSAAAAAAASTGRGGKFARPSTASTQVDAVSWTCDDRCLITSEIRQASKSAPCTDQAIKVLKKEKKEKKRKLCFVLLTSTILFYFE
jgi:WD40 repeat protein